MRVIVPMAGSGARFAAAGYKEPKPLIPVDGRPMIERVVEMFPRGSDFLFICREDHLDGAGLRGVLERIAPGCDIVAVPAHKLGPVHSVGAAFDRIDDEGEAVVNYCDFAAYWDFEDFAAFVRTERADGAVPAYRGFHPHSLNGNNYAFMRADGARMLEIREKEPFTEDRMYEFASSGTYYFRTGALLKKHFTELLQNGPAVGGEFYASMPFNFLVRDGLKVVIYELQHMLQWGTPEDLEEYAGWSGCFHRALQTREGDESALGINIIPMAGLGARFAPAGYAVPKPLLPVGGKPMFVRAAEALPAAARNIFVCLKDHLDAYEQLMGAAKAFPGGEVVELDAPTEGQAVSCAAALGRVPPGEPFMVGACDNGMQWDRAQFAALAASGADAIIWTARGHRPAARSPRGYGWVAEGERGRVAAVSVKQPLSDSPMRDHAITGAFWFRSREVYMSGLEKMRASRGRDAGEYYIDGLAGALVELGLDVRLFEVSRWICWGTPDEYRTYLYWQSFFHKCAWHPYRLDLDPGVTPEAAAELDSEYRRFERAGGGAA